MAKPKKYKQSVGKEHLATAKSLDLHISSKHSVEICNSLRYKTTAYAKKFLQEVTELKAAVPYRRHVRNVGHKAGMSTGRFPEKAARQFLKLINSVEANAQFKGLNTSELKITKILANRASLPMGGGRHRYKTKRTHLEVEVKELSPKKEGKKKADNQKGVEAKPETSKQKTTSVGLPAESMGASLVTPSGVAAKPAMVENESAVKKSVVNNQPPTAQHSTAAQSVKKAQIIEPSPADLLKQVQARAERFNGKQKQSTDVKNVEGLYDELQKKGTLR